MSSGTYAGTSAGMRLWEVGEECPSASKWPVCARCNSNRAKLSMMFGKWPPRCFQKLHSQTQQQFWRNCAGCKTRDELEVELVARVADFEVESEGKRLGGQYLPLSMYKAKGLTKGQVDGIQYTFDSTRVPRLPQ